MDTTRLLESTVLTVHVSFPQAASDVAELLRVLGEIWPNATIDQDGAIVVPAVSR